LSCGMTYSLIIRKFSNCSALGIWRP
jgi:hypothetical protein